MSLGGGGDEESDDAESSEAKATAMERAKKFRAVKNKDIVRVRTVLRRKGNSGKISNKN